MKNIVRGLLARTDRDRLSGTVYFHYPCFDGLASAAIAANFLESSQGWKIERFEAVNYDVARSWLEFELPKPSAVVDFLYHPRASFWADHHATTFVNEKATAHFANEENLGERTLLYDRDCASCAMLLFRHLASRLGDRKKYSELASWADKIDSASYSSVTEAIFGDTPALEINRSLADETATAREYYELLLRSLSRMSLQQVASLHEVRLRADSVRERTRLGLEDVRKTISCGPGDICSFWATQTSDNIVNRYSPYVFFPEARYSVGLIQSGNNFKITAMRNPWRDFESVPLGEIFKRFGGGGHQRVASLVIPSSNESDASQIAESIVDEIRKFDDHIRIKTSYA